MPTSYIEKLKQYIDVTIDTDPTWVQFVKDHRSAILQTARTVSIPANTMFSNRFRLRHLLFELGYKQNLDWVVMWLNDLSSSVSVINLSELIIPDEKYLKELHTTYNSFKSKSASI